MKLAEALILRADMQKTIAQLRNRMEKNAKVQEGEAPSEDATELLQKHDILMDELEALIIRINATNSAVTFEADTLVAAIVKRDNLRAKISAYRGLYDSAAIRQERYSRSEVKYMRCIDTAMLQERINAMSRQFRELDTAIQAKNWECDLL